VFILNFWLIFGFLAQGLFALRFLVQWLYSEYRKESFVPVYFWYISLLGGILILIYSIHIKDPVFIVGQTCGIFVYIRNLMLIYSRKREKTSD